MIMAMVHGRLMPRIYREICVRDTYLTSHHRYRHRHRHRRHRHLVRSYEKHKGFIYYAKL